MNNQAKCVLAMILAACVPLQTSIAAIILADAITAADFIASADEHLYMNSSFTTLAPVGTSIWFVVDKNGDGVPQASATETGIQDMLAGSPTGDNESLFEGIVDGDLLGSQPGKFKKGAIDIDASHDGKHFYAYLWNNVNGNGTTGDAGDTFGVFDLGLTSRPGGIGNLLFDITGNVSADQFTVVPEPAEYGVVAASVCLLAALVRKKFRSASRDPFRALRAPCAD